MEKQSQPKKYQYINQIKKFQKNLEKADLLISHIKKYGIVLYGETKAGKTSTAHLLSGNILSGVKIDGEYFLTNPGTNNYQQAKIGMDLNSQTQLPNIFQVKLKSQYSQVTLVDTPGYGDSNGMFSLIANAYYHYKLYEKIQNMKFIICIERDNLNGLAKTLFSTLNQFTSSFKNYPQVKTTILKSCAFLITKVPESDTPQQTQNDLESKLKKIVSTVKTQFPEGQDKIMREMLTYLIENKRVFYIKKYKNKDIAQNSQLLEKINKAVTNWWTRKLDETKGIIDMQPIKLSIIKKIDCLTRQSAKTKQELKELTNYYNDLAKQFLPINITQESEINGTICQVLSEIMRDSRLRCYSSHEFIKLMKIYIEKFYLIFQQEIEPKRKQIQRELFFMKMGQNKTKGKVDQNDFHYLIKKFNFTFQSFELMKAQGTKDYDEKSQERLLSYRDTIISVLKQFNTICYEFENLVNVIYKYNYIIFRLVEECKVFYHLMQQVKGQQKMEEHIDIFDPIKRFLNWQPDEFDPQLIKQEFLTSYNPSEQTLGNFVVDEIVIKFFTDSQSIQSCQNCHRLQLTITKLLIKYSLQILQQKQIQDRKIFNTLISRLSIYRKSCSNVHLKGEKQQKQQATILIRKATDQLGKMLIKIGRYQKAIQVYNSINCVHQVKRLYDRLISDADLKKTRNKYPKQSVTLRLKYAAYLQEHFMQQKAIVVLQDAHDMSQSFDDIEKTSQLINKHYLSQKSNTLQSETYKKQLSNKTYFEPLPKSIQKQLQEYDKLV